MSSQRAIGAILEPGIADAAGDMVTSAGSVRPLPKRIYRLVKKIHMYMGLLVYVQITIYGVAGLNTTFASAPADREPFPFTTSSLDYTPRLGATDKEIADEIHALIDPPLSGPVPAWAIRHTPDGELLVNFYSLNGPTRVRVVAGEGRLEVERVRNSFPRFLSNLHAVTLREYTGDVRLLAWAWLNEAGIWSLLLLALSGVYLWLATRPQLRLALTSLTAGLAAFILLWAIIR